MARRRKGRDISGWIIIDKPAGMGSTDVVNKVRWAFQAQKAGHAGTLDPAATGLLAVALGEATKVIPYVTDDLKAYDFTLRWGQATTTDDAEGEVIATSDARPDEAAIRAALPAFEGNIRQVPPAFSAVKVDGQRAYDLARAGEEVELKARDLFVESLTLQELPDADHARLELVCGQGRLCPLDRPRPGRGPGHPRPCHRPAPRLVRPLRPGKRRDHGADRGTGPHRRDRRPAASA